MDNGLDPDTTQLFKRKDTSFDNLDTLEKARVSLNDYIRKTRESGSLAHDNVANMEIVLNVKPIQDIVRICHDEYGVGQSNDTEQEKALVFESIFKTLADQIFTEGDFDAY